MYVGYRYFDKVKTQALFPFGHGLSYTTFAFSAPRVDKQSGNTLAISINVKNTGSRAGSEVVQVYVSHSRPRINRPKKELKGFKKISLAAGEERLVQVVLDLKIATSFWDEYNDQWCSQSGKYVVEIGNSSAGHFQKTEFDVEKDCFWLGLGA